MTEPTIDLAELTRRLGLPADQATTVAAFVGDPDRDGWTEAEAAELAEVWQRTCGAHGVYDCGECPARPAAVKYPSVTVRLSSGVNGNALAVVAAVARAIQGEVSREAADEYRRAALASGSYDALLSHAMATVNVI